jgi:hypothetical protein
MFKALGIAPNNLLYFLDLGHDVYEWRNPTICRATTTLQSIFTVRREIAAMIFFLYTTPNVGGKGRRIDVFALIRYSCLK